MSYYIIYNIIIMATCAKANLALLQDGFCSKTMHSGVRDEQCIMQ